MTPMTPLTPSESPIRVNDLRIAVQKTTEVQNSDPKATIGPKIDLNRQIVLQINGNSVAKYRKCRSFGRNLGNSGNILEKIEKIVERVETSVETSVETIVVVVAADGTVD